MNLKDQYQVWYIDKDGTLKLTFFQLRAIINKFLIGNNIMEKTKQLLAYLVQHYTSVSITGLMKLAYISDLVSIKKGMSQISDFEYIRYKYGPFDNKIYTYIHELIYDNVIIEEASYTQMGDEYIIYRFNEDNAYSFNELNDNEISVANEVIESLKGYGAKALVDLAYRTKPMANIGAKQDNDVGLNQKLDLRTA